MLSSQVCICWLFYDSYLCLIQTNFRPRTIHFDKYIHNQASLNTLDWIYDCFTHAAFSVNLTAYFHLGSHISGRLQEMFCVLVWAKA